MTRRYRMNLSIRAEISADFPNAAQITPEVLVNALQNPDTKPLLEEATARVVLMLDGYIHFYTEARVSDREGEKVVMEMPDAELNSVFQRKLRAAKLLGEVAVTSVAVISPKVDHAREREHW
jgi:hypothetical protein